MKPDKEQNQGNKKKHDKPNLLLRIGKVYLERVVRSLVELGLSSKAAEAIIASISEETVNAVAEGSTLLGGALHLNRSHFPEGSTGEALYHIANDLLDETGKEFGNILREKKSQLGQADVDGLFTSFSKRLKEKRNGLADAFKARAVTKRASPAEIIDALRREDKKAHAELVKWLNTLSSAKYDEVMSDFYHLDSVTELRGILSLPAERRFKSLSLLKEKSLAGSLAREAREIKEALKAPAKMLKKIKKALDTPMPDEKVSELECRRAELETQKKQARSVKEFFKVWKPFSL